MNLWEQLSHEDHDLLCELAPPHGNLFAWVDQQHHEHGSQTWGILREALRGSELEDLALRIMSTANAPLHDDQGQPLPDTATPADVLREAQQELRGIVNRLLIESLKTQETEAIQMATSDPTALQRYRELQARRLALESSQKQMA